MLRDRPGRHAGGPPDLASALADLDRLRRERPELDSPARALADVLVATFSEPDSSAAYDDESSETLLDRARAEGRPVFAISPPMLVSRTLARRAMRICDALRSEDPRAKPLRRAIRSGRIDLAKLGGAILTDAPPSLDDPSLDPDLTASVLRLALLPTLASASQGLGRRRGDDGRSRGDCPNCGGPPLLAESRGLEQARFLRCGLCAAEWPTLRLRCPTCGTEDPAKLRSAFVEGEESRFRLLLCDRCGTRLKVVSTLVPLSPPALLVAELATVHLDLIDPGRLDASLERADTGDRPA
jgi:hypothetical protein